MDIEAMLITVDDDVEVTNVMLMFKVGKNPEFVDAACSACFTHEPILLNDMTMKVISVELDPIVEEPRYYRFELVPAL